MFTGAIASSEESELAEYFNANKQLKGHKLSVKAKPPVILSLIPTPQEEEPSIFKERKQATVKYGRALVAWYSFFSDID